MLCLWLFIFLKIIAFTQTSKPRSVNLALETVLEFDNHDDMEFIDNMQNFLNKLKRTIARQRASNDKGVMREGKDETEAPKAFRKDEKDEREETEAQKTFKFTDLLSETLSVIRSYTDDDLKKFFRTLDSELNTMHGNKFLYVADKLGFRRLVDNKLRSLKNYPAQKLRSKLNSLHDKLHSGKLKGKQGFVADFLNYLYKKESKDELSRVIQNLKLYRSRTRRGFDDLKRIIRSGIDTIIEPLLKLSSNANKEFSALYLEYTNNTKINEKKYNLEIKHRPHILRETIDVSRKLPKGDNILDYIEDHRNVINKHRATKYHLNNQKNKSKSKRFKTTGTTETYSRFKTTGISKKFIYTTRKSKKIRSTPKSHSTEEVTVKLRKKKNMRNKKIKTTTETTVALFDNNISADKNKNEPVFIKIESSNEATSDSSSEEETPTTTQRTPQKRFKITRRLTTKDEAYSETTKKSRKAFKTTTSYEGLSIEHFGSLAGSKFYRKNNENDTFLQTFHNTTSPDLETTTTEGKKEERGGGLSITKEIKRDNLSNRNEKPEHKPDKSFDSVTQNTKSADDSEATPSLKIGGDIIIESPSKTNQHGKTEITSIQLTNESTTKRYNVSIVTKYFDIKPASNLRRQATNITNVITRTTPITSKIAETTQTPQANNSETESAATKTPDIDDELENEIYNEIDEHNGTQAFADNLDSYMKNVGNAGESDKIRDQMRSDLAKIFAPSTTQKAELFTDPFDGLDNGDIFLR